MRGIGFLVARRRLVSELKKFGKRSWCVNDVLNLFGPSNPKTTWYQSVARSLSLDPQTLLSYCSPTTISQPAVLEPAHSSTSAFLLLTHSIFHLPHLRASFLGNHSSTELLRMNLGSIMIALGGAEGRGGRGGEDETLFWCWWCIQNAIKDGEFISEEMLFTLIKVSQPRSILICPSLEYWSASRNSSWALQRPFHPSLPSDSWLLDWCLLSLFELPKRKRFKWWFWKIYWSIVLTKRWELLQVAFCARYWSQSSTHRSVLPLLRPQGRT